MLRLSKELPCCKVCDKRNTCYKKYFEGALKCQKTYEMELKFHINARQIGRSRIIDILSNEDIVAQTEYIRDLRRKNRRQNIYLRL